jgi:hypothetical protein
MELEALQRQWQCLDEKLGHVMELEKESLRLAVMQPARRRINHMAIWPAIDVVFAVVVQIIVGFFIRAHWNTISLVLPAAILIVAAMMLLIDSIRALVLVSEINWDGPVADIQSSLSRLRVAKIRQFKWVMLFCPLLGFCALLVGAQWLLDRLPERPLLLEKLNPWWVAVNYAFGVLFVPFGHLVIRALAARFGHRGWWQHALDDISGSSMTNARAELDRWTSMMHETRNSTDC